MKLKNKVAVITGGGRGLGRAIALAMAWEGAGITIMSRTRRQLDEVLDDIQAAGGRGLAVEGDVSREGDVIRMVDETRSYFGGVDILVNNAAVVGPARFLEDTGSGAWEKTIAINLHGAFYCTRAVVPIMASRGGGKIISITSGLGERPYPRFCAYGVSKAGISQLTRSLSVELEEMNIQVNAISPGVMDTAMQAEIRAMGPEMLGSLVYHQFLENKEKGLLKDPAEIARLAVFLVSPEAEHLTGYYGTPSEYRHLGWKG